MFGFLKSPGNKISKQNSADPGAIGSSVDSNTKNQIPNPARRTSSEPMLITPDISNGTPPSSSSSFFGGKNKYQNDFSDSGGLENQSVQELENYAAYKSEETTKSVNNCLRIAENIRGDATRTLDMLHQQGEQINRTHMMAADMDKDLAKGEKALGSLGGIFSKPWRPKRGKDITGPSSKPDSSKRSENDSEQRDKLGLAPKGGRSANRTPPPEPTNALQKVEVEKAKQDDALSDLSNILDDLKGMAVDMGSELERQNHALDHLNEDVETLNDRVRGANQRARKLVGGK